MEPIKQRRQPIETQDPEMDASLEAPQAPPQAPAAETVSRPNHIAQPFAFNRKAFAITAIIILLLLLGGTIWLVMNARKANQAAIDKPDNFSVSDLKISDQEGKANLEVGDGGQLTINGELQIAKTVVVAPTAAPTKPTAGQIYYDGANNTMYYYNGTQFVSMAPTPQTPSVTALGGVSGNIGVGDGLQVTANQLSLTPQAAQALGPRVTSLQGLTGDINLVAGAGISINGTTISSTAAAGITGITGANGLGVSQSGGQVTLTLPQLLGTSDSPVFAGLTLGTNGALGAFYVNASNQLQFSPVTASVSGGKCFMSNGTSTVGWGTCPGGGGGSFVALQPGSAQDDPGAGSSIFVNNTGGGNLLQLQGNGADRFVVANNGNVTVSGNLTVDTNTLLVDATNNLVAIGQSVSTTGAKLQVAGGAQLLGSTSGDNANLAGTIVYDTGIGKFQIYEGVAGELKTLCNTADGCATSGGATTLAKAYENYSSGPASIILDSGRGGIIIQDALTPIAADLFTVQSNGGTTKFLNVTNAGASVAGSLSVTGGATISGGTTSINTNSNNNTNINTGSSAGLVNIGNSAAGAITLQSASSINLTAAANSAISVGSGNTLTVTASNFSVTNDGQLTLGSTAQQGKLILSDGSSNTVTLQSAALGSNLTFTLPSSAGANLQCLKTNGSGVLTWGSCLSGGPGSGVDAIGDGVDQLTGDVTVESSDGSILVDSSGGTLDLTVVGGDTCSGCANQNLGNLSDTTAINKSLLPADDNTIDLGSSIKQFRDGYFGRDLQVAGDLTIDTNTLLVDATNNLVAIGQSVSTTGAKLQVAGGAQLLGSTSGDNANLAGTIVYDTGIGKFQIYEGVAGELKTLCNTADGCATSGGATTLAKAYENYSSGPASIILDSGRGGIIIQDALTPIAADLFTVQSNGGTKFLNVTASGASVAGGLSVTGNLAIDTNTLVVNAASDQVAIGQVVNTNGSKLQVNGGVQLVANAAASYNANLAGTIVYDSGDNKFKIYEAGGSSAALKTICNSVDGCATAGGAVTLQGAYDNYNSNPAIINLNASRGGVQIRDASSTVGTLFSVQDDVGNPYLQVVSGAVGIGGALTVAPGSVFTNSSSTLFTAISINDLPSGGAIGTAAATVDVATTFSVSQTTPGQTLILPNPLVSAAGRIVYVNNIGSTSFTMAGVVIPADGSQAFIWNGSGWKTVNAPGSGVTGTGSNNRLAKFNGTSSITDSILEEGTNTITLQTSTNPATLTSSNALSVLAGAGNLTLDSAASGTVNLGDANAATVNVGSVGSTAKATTVNIANTSGNATQIVNIGSTGSANNAVLIQGGTTASALELRTGSSGTIKIASSAVAGTVQIGNTSGTVSQVINIGNNGTVGSTTTLRLGSLTDNSTTTIQGGNTGTAISMQQGSGGAISIGTITPGTITIGNTSAPVNLASGLYTGGTAAGNLRVTSAGVLQNVSMGTAAGALVTANGGGIQVVTNAVGGNACLQSAGATNTPQWLACPTGSGGWGLSGNSISGGDFLGTTNAQDLVLKTNTGGGGAGQLTIAGSSSAGTVTIKGGPGGGVIFEVTNNTPNPLFRVTDNAGISAAFRNNVGGITQVCFNNTPNGSSLVELGGCSSSMTYKHGLEALNNDQYGDILNKIRNTDIYHYYHNTSSPDFQRTGVIAEYMPQELTQLDGNGVPVPDWFSVYGWLWAGTRALADQTALLSSAQQAQSGQIGSLSVGQSNLSSQIAGLSGGQQSLVSQVNALNALLSPAGSTIQPQAVSTSSLNVSGAATVGTLHVTGDATIDGALTVGSVTTATLRVNGHIITGGDTPASQVLTALGGAGANVAVEGNDTSGTITITAGAGGLTPGELAEISFAQAYGQAPRIVISAQDEAAADARVFPTAKSATGFKLKTGQALQPGQTYSFDYFITQ